MQGNSQKGVESQHPQPAQYIASAVDQRNSQKGVERMEELFYYRLITQILLKLPKGSRKITE